MRGPAARCEVGCPAARLVAPRLGRLWDGAVAGPARAPGARGREALRPPLLGREASAERSGDAQR